MPFENTLLTLATYNIHCCIGRDGRFNPDRIINVIQALNADVIALQEMESAYNSGKNLLDIFSEKTGMHIIPGLTMFKGASCYGNAVLTRHEIKAIHHINISVPNREPRGAIRLMFNWRSKTIQIIATHLGLKRLERRNQAQLILKEFENHASDISVLMGDLNEWNDRGRTIRHLRNHFCDTGSPATFPSFFPVLLLDRILVHPSSCIHSIEPVKNKFTRIASDHLPLKATLAV